MTTKLRADLMTRGIAPDCIETILMVRDVLARVGDKWTLLILTVLEDGPKRYTTLHELVPGISQRMLGQTLRALHRDGIVTRTVYAEVPPRVEYELTDLGRSFVTAVGQLVGWVTDNRAALIRHRADYDARS